MFYMFCSSIRYVLYFLSACSCNLCCDRFLILSHLLVADQLPSADCWALPLSWWLLPGSSCYNIRECILIGFRPVHNSPATCSIVSFARLCMSAPTLWDIWQHAVSAQLPPGTLVTWALISATVSKQPYNMCDVAGVCVPWCIFHQRFSGAWLKCVYRLPISSAVCSTSSSETASRNKVTCSSSNQYYQMSGHS